MSELTSYLAADAHEDEIIDSLNIDNYRGPAALMPGPDGVEDSETDMRVKKLMDFALYKGNTPMMFDDGARAKVREPLKQKFEELLQLEPEDATINDLRLTSSHMLRTIDERYGISDEALQTVGDTVTDYMKKLGFENIRTPSKILVEEGDGRVGGRHNFSDDRINIISKDVGTSVVANSFLPVWVHEAVHKENNETLVGHERAESVRKATHDYTQIDDKVREAIEPQIESLPGVNQKLAKGLIMDEVVPRLDMPDPYSVRVENGDYEASIVLDNGCLKAAGIIHHNGPEPDRAGIYNMSFDKESVLNELNSSFSDLPAQFVEDIEQVFDEVENDYAEPINQAEALTHDIIEEYSLDKFDYRDEALAYFAEFITRNQYPEETSEIERHYNQKDAYGDKTGTKIVEDLGKWFQAFETMEGPGKDRFAYLMTRDNREVYLKTGEIPDV